MIFIRSSDVSDMLAIVGQLAILTELRVLRLCCYFTMVPESLSELVTLTTLDLSGCHELTGLPESLSQLALLTTLNLCGCYGFCL
jgi:hypothetical protein